MHDHDCKIILFGEQKPQHFAFPIPLILLTETFFLIYVFLPIFVDEEQDIAWKPKQIEDFYPPDKYPDKKYIHSSLACVASVIFSGNTHRKFQMQHRQIYLQKQAHTRFELGRT